MLKCILLPFITVTHFEAAMIIIISELCLYYVSFERGITNIVILEQVIVNDYQ